MPSRSTSSGSSSRSRGSGVLLDPYGIYGTRTANRMRAAQRRRQTQNAILLLVVVLLLAGGAAFSKFRRVTSVKPSNRLELLTTTVIPPIAARDAKTKTDVALIPTAGGQLLRVPLAFASDEAPQVVLDTAFPLHLPLVRDNVAFVPCEDGVLYAVDWQKSKVLWRYDFHSPLTARPTWTKFAVGNPAAAGGAAGPSTASTASTTATPNAAAVVAGPRVVTREVVIAGADNGLLVALDSKTGNERWRMRLPSPPGEAIAVSNEAKPKVLVPLVGTAFMRGGVWCLDALTGKVLWRFPKDGLAEAIQLSAPAVDVAANRVFFGGESGAVFSLDLRNGTYNAKKKIGWKTYATPLKRAGDAVISWRTNPVLFFSNERDGRSTRLVVGGSDGGVRCFASSDGALLWEVRAEAPIESLQKFASGERDLLLVCTRGADLFVVDAASGRYVRKMASRSTLVGAVLAGNEVLAVTTDGFVERFPLGL
jgi:outer membrane protein assembly factor BamB